MPEQTPNAQCPAFDAKSVSAEPVGTSVCRRAHPSASRGVAIAGGALSGHREQAVTGDCSASAGSANAERVQRPMPRGKRALWTSSRHGEQAVPSTRQGERSMVASPTLAETPSQIGSPSQFEITSPRGSVSEWPLLILGPGGDYARRYVAVGTAIERERPAHAVVEGAREVASRPHADGVLVRALRLFRSMIVRFDAIALEVFTVQSTETSDAVVAAVPTPATAAPRRSGTLIEIKETADEPHSQADEGAAHRTRHAEATGLLAHDAGDRRRTPRQQGHGSSTSRR